MLRYCYGKYSPRFGREKPSFLDKTRFTGYCSASASRWVSQYDSYFCWHSGTPLRAGWNTSPNKASNYLWGSVSQSPILLRYLWQLKHVLSCAFHKYVDHASYRRSTVQLSHAKPTKTFWWPLSHTHSFFSFPAVNVKNNHQQKQKHIHDKLPEQWDFHSSSPLSF